VLYQLSYVGSRPTVPGSWAGLFRAYGGKAGLQLPVWSVSSRDRRIRAETQFASSSSDTVLAATPTRISRSLINLVIVDSWFKAVPFDERVHA
jgi:hypothetical protein